jgi:hypothetical protein
MLETMISMLERHLNFRMLERHPGVVLERHARLLERQYAGKASEVLERHTKAAGKAVCWNGI